MSKKKINIKIKRKRKLISIYGILAIICIVLVLVATSYALWSTRLTINNTTTLTYVEQQLPVTPVASGSRYSANTNLTTKIAGVTRKIFNSAGDTYEGNVVTTKISNSSSVTEKTWWDVGCDVTFTMTIKNNASTTLTNGTIADVTENDPGGYMSTNSYSLSTTTISSGSTATLTCSIKYNSSVQIESGSYVLFKIYYRENNIKKYFYYKVLIS